MANRSGWAAAKPWRWVATMLLVGGAAALTGCNCGRSGETSTAETARVARPMSEPPTQAPGARPRMGGGQPVMPMLKGYAIPDERVTVFVTILDPKDDETLAYVSATLQGEENAALEFSKVAKIEYWGQEYDVSKGMVIPPGAKNFTFDIVVAKQLAPEPPDTASYVFELTMSTTTVKTKFGLVVDLPAP